MSNKKVTTTETKNNNNNNNGNSVKKVNTTKEGLIPIGVDIIELQSKLLNRAARKQSTQINSRYEEHDVDGTEYNIWYGKKIGQKRQSWRDRVASETRCNLLKDCGKTKAAKGASFCLHFAKGRCVNGSECTFYHRIPTPEDDLKLDMAHDIFGRQRYKLDRDDMGGVGSFSRDNRTLFIGGIKSFGATIDESLRRAFEEWGPIEYVRTIPAKTIAFVRYLYRSSAEFAKEAMADQTLDNGDLLNIRWASEDCNPLAKMADERNFHRVATEAVNKKLKEMTPEQKSTVAIEMTGNYPNTDTQYPQLTDGRETTNNTQDNTYQLQYPGSVKYEVHPYAKMYNKKLTEKKEKGLLGDEVKPLSSTTVGNYFNLQTGSNSKQNSNNNSNSNLSAEEMKKQYDDYLSNYYKSYGYDYSQLTEEQKQQLIQYSQNYYQQGSNENNSSNSNGNGEEKLVAQYEDEDDEDENDE
ncbi:hypothetical protein DLAC_05673 [Tieghemostelium lacteum]|uniref:Pre-mRNA-splicing factor cwc2 n=1 Tax=Tieghemostelium lacteum TaxID=361077 RepID=A0A151ZGG5_TIELA|nr:hypothetical protein DLAC_05673 [Tieghemostelium lacteum]|eukprot:KYQ93062.1 hypothetical protein DLAC_05673 [Tieghemostelium lacteum]